MSAATTAIIREPDHAARAVSADLPSQFRDLPRWKALVRAIGHGIQVLEDDGFSLLVDSILDLATGVHLERWGEVVGEERWGLTDQVYRRFIKARILVNRSARTQDDLAEIYRVLTEPISVRIWSLSPAHVRLECVRHAFMPKLERRRVARTMEAARPAGVSFALVEAVDGYLGFDGDPAAFGYTDGILSRRIDL